MIVFAHILLGAAAGGKTIIANARNALSFTFIAEAFGGLTILFGLTYATLDH